jgi:minor extracellular serine protease Vpr
VRSLRAPLALALMACLALAAPASAARPAAGDSTDATVNRAELTRQYALVQLKGAPLSTSAKTRPSGGKRINFSSETTKSYRAQLAAIRNEYKDWLRVNAPNARVSNEFDISIHVVAVRLNGHTLAQISGSSLVLTAQYERLYYPLGHDDPDLSLIDAAEGWAAAGGAANAGEGVKVAIVDTGIDVTHPCFDDAGYAEGNNPGAHEPYTNDKVIVAKVFYNKSAVRGLDPKDVDGHGTHVAGTVACNLHTPAQVHGVDIPYDPSGVAPRALLGNYNVFPGTVASARSEDIVDALEEAYADGMHVANMSLGGGSSGFNDLLAMAVDNLDRANMVIAVAAGNSGPGYFTIESPGKAARALTAGASTVGHFVGAPVTVAGSTYGAAAGDFAVVQEDLTAPLGVVTSAPTNPATGLSVACTALPAGSLSGKIALISRGVCTFSTKIRNAQNAGAVAVLVVNNVAGDPTAMAQDGTANQPTVPAYMVGLKDGKALDDHNGASTTIDSTLAYFNTDNDDIMAGFSSQGPTDVDFRVKPDVTAPGVNVLSSQPSHTCPEAERPCWAFFQGTSMATPHLAGSAAVVRGAHPGWAAWQVRSAVVNTAERGRLTAFTDGTTVLDDANITGSGIVDLDSAVGADVVLDPVSVSFGAIPAGSGLTGSRSVRLTNVSGAPATFTLAVGPSTGTGVSYGVSSASVTLANGATATVQVTMTAAKNSSRGHHRAWLEVRSGGANVAHAAVYTFVK